MQKYCTVKYWESLKIYLVVMKMSQCKNGTLLLLYHSKPLFMWEIQTLNFIALWFILACLLLFCVLFQTNSARSCKPREATVLDENVSGQHYTSYSWTTQQFCSGACSVGCFWSLLALHDLMWFTVTLFQTKTKTF